MSRVLLIAADKPLPLCDKQTQRSKTVTIPDDVDSALRGKRFTVTAPAGFKVEAHRYYRHAVDELELSIKPYQYELHLEVHEEDLADLKAYLTENLTAGEEVELWNLWVGIDREADPDHYRGPLAAFDMDTLEQLLAHRSKDDKIGQCRLTVTL